MTIWVLFMAAAHILGIISTLHVLMTGRTSQGTIAWGVTLNTFPVVAVPAYWILGRSKFEGYVTTKRMANSDFDREYQYLIDQLSAHRIPKADLPFGGVAAELVADLPFLTGNKTELLINGEKTFDSILKGMAEAEHYILFQFYIVHDDEIGRKIKDLLLSKATAGVQVYFLYDEIGSHDLPKAYLNELKAAGVQAHAFNTRKGPRNRFQINFRNHRKIVVVDGAKAWIGGHNVGDEYLGKDPTFGNWRDTHMKITGPAALAAQLSFSTDWHWATDDAMLHLNWKPVPSADSDVPVIVVPSGPADDVETASLMFLHAINAAKERIWIQSPYFVPDDAIISALQLAAMRGVDVRILIPDAIDHTMVWLCAFSYYDDATATGANIYRYTNGFLHAKTILIDDITSAVGTANLDNRSLRLNFEVTSWVYDKTFAAEMEQMYLNDFENSRLMTTDDLGKRPWWFKLAVRFARLTAPIQ
ncbi:cardiolipin synthase [Pontiellaceae bacterium B12227]|nr:cardiolipin synthase [Pontiellaceae bacterium B12227]